MKPIVSILIPAYNAQPWIADTLRSVIAQTWPNKEVIVVDDGSQDQTLSIARQFVSKEVRVVTQENAGASVARNKAFELCQGDYIQWLDADDLLAPDKISRQMEAAEGQSKRALLSSAWGYFRYRPYRARFIPSPLWSDLTPLEWLQRKWEHNVHMNPATWLVTRETTENAGPWDTRLMCGEDGEYFARVVRASDSIRFVPEARVLYRKRPSSASYVGRSNRKMEAVFLQIQLEISHLRSLDDSERTRAACLKFLQTWLVFFYPQRLDLVQQAQELAAALGGELHTPRMSWKYAWMQKLLGKDFAKRAQLGLSGLRSSLADSWDKAMLRLEERRKTRASAG